MIANPSTSEDIIVLEFNELCPELMDRFIGKGMLPNFKKLRDHSVAMITDAEEEVAKLEPWIQWVSIHSGLKADEHEVFDLGDGSRLNQVCIAKIISDHGLRVGVLGSMNTNYRDLNGFHVPDPWDLNGRADPPFLQPFYEIVSNQVQESSKSEGLSKSDMAKFGWFMVRHGMRQSSVRSAISQLWSERKDKGFEWRRPIILEQLQFDLFRHLKRKMNTQFNTFFCNSTAHFQHYYWRNMEPEYFDVPPDDTDHASLASAIEYGYKKMDELVGEFFREFPDSRLVLLTALSQQAWKDTTKCTFRPRDFNEFLKFVGVDPGDVEVKPVMAEEFRVIPKQSGDLQSIQEKILQARVSDEVAMKARLDGEDIFCGCVINRATARQQEIEHPDGGKRTFEELFHMVHSMRSGRHDPHGLFWVQSDKPRVERNPVPLVNVAPTLLSLMGIDAPSHMSGQVIPLEAPALASV